MVEVADQAGDKSLADTIKTVVATGDTKSIESVLNLFDIKSMSKEDIKTVYDALGSSKLEKVKIEQFQKLLLKEVEAVPVDIVKGVKAEEGMVTPKVITEAERQAEIRARVLKNINESRIAREASTYKEFTEFEKTLKVEVSLK